jgi:hypothetical protein
MPVSRRLQGHATTRGELTRRANLALRTAAKKGPGSIVGFDIAIDTTSNDQKFIPSRTAASDQRQ